VDSFRLLAVCYSLVIRLGVMGRDVLAKGEWDETWARHAREEKQAVSSHVFEDIQTCQKLIKLTSKPIKIN